jgi:hypothetical protein
MGVKISNLPNIVTPALSDVFPVVQSGITYKESFTQLTSLFATAGANTNITSIGGLSTAGIIGTTTNNNANAGSVGEIIESTVLVGSAVSVPASGDIIDITSISLTAGDWDVYGTVATAPDAGTTTSTISGWVSSTSVTAPTLPNSGGRFLVHYASSAGGANALPTGKRRFSLAGTTTIYLSGTAEFAVSTMGLYGYIGARRVR